MILILHIYVFSVGHKNGFPVILVKYKSQYDIKYYNIRCH